MVSRQELPRKLVENLEPGETVLYAVKRRFALEKPGWLIVTDRRIILFDEKILGRYDMKAIPYEKLERIQYHSGIVASRFEIKTESGEEHVLTWLDKDTAEKAIKAVYEALKRIAVEPPTVEKRKGLTSTDLVLKKPKELVSRAYPRPPAAAAAAAPVQQTGSSEGSGDPLELLRKLRELYEAGVISREEYEEKKKRIMEKI